VYCNSFLERLLIKGCQRELSGLLSWPCRPLYAFAFGLGSLIPTVLYGGAFRGAFLIAHIPFFILEKIMNETTTIYFLPFLKYYEGDERIHWLESE